MWPGPTHIFDDVNLADAFHTSMMTIGGVLVLLGIGLLAHAVLKDTQPDQSLADETQVSV